MLSTNDFEMSHSHYLTAFQPLPAPFPLPPARPHPSFPPARSPSPPPMRGILWPVILFFSKEPTEFWTSQMKTSKLPSYKLYRRLGCLNLPSIESGGLIKMGCPKIMWLTGPPESWVHGYGLQVLLIVYRVLGFFMKEEGLFKSFSSHSPVWLVCLLFQKITRWKTFWIELSHSYPLELFFR